jgi:hypothetical protein
MRTSVLKQEVIRMPVRFRTSGCLWSIVASIALTIILNLLLRGCA